MAILGYVVLLTTFVVCSYAAGVSVAGARRGSRRLIESGIGAFHMVTALMVLASVLSTFAVFYLRGSVLRLAMLLVSALMILAASSHEVRVRVLAS